MQEEGNGIPTNKEKAKKILQKKAADLGDYESMYKYAFLLDYNSSKKQEITKYLKKSSQFG